MITKTGAAKTHSVLECGTPGWASSPHSISALSNNMAKPSGSYAKKKKKNDLTKGIFSDF